MIKLKLEPILYKTVRPNFIQESNPDYYNLINEFYKLTSIPALLKQF